MADKVKIELTPYNALLILKFMREFVNDDNADEPTFAAIHEAIYECECQVSENMTDDQLEDGRAENQVNQLIGKSPMRE